MICDKKMAWSKWFTEWSLFCWQQCKVQTPVLRLDVSGYSDMCIIVKGRISLEGTAADNQTNKKLTFNKNAPFRSCISKINNKRIDNEEDLIAVMLMYNLLECSNNYSMTSKGWWNYYRDEVNDAANEYDAATYRVNNKKETTGRSFEYKTQIAGKNISYFK